MQYERPMFDPWVGKILWRREWLPIPVFLPGESQARGAWWARVHGVTKSWTRLINFHFQQENTGLINATNHWPHSRPGFLVS